jgi:hypothetical protein
MHLVIDLFIKAFDKNVALTRLAEGRISLRPHDTTEEMLIVDCSFRNLN